jgi:diguanylate cyclase (GGDEF)-like protein
VVKLRLIVLSLALLSLIIVVMGSLFYYAILKETVLAEANRRTASDAAAIGRMFTAYLSENTKSVKVLAGMEITKRALHESSAAALTAANHMLDHFQQSMGTDVCYLMNTRGLTVASSNRDQPRSFVGKNFAFRPYFQHALRGEAWVYMALGATSLKRGVYYSHPVYHAADQVPVGVVVIKAGLDQIEERASAISTRHDGAWALVNSDGVIFASNRKEWRFHFLGYADDQRRADIARSRQFGREPLAELGFMENGPHQMRDPDGVEYLAHGQDLDGMGGWQVLFLNKTHRALAVLRDPIVQYRKPIIMVTGFIFSVVILILSSMAMSDIRERKRKRDVLAMQNAYLSALHETTLGLIGRLEFHELIGAVLSRAGNLTGTQNGFLYLYHPEAGELELMVGLGVYKDEVGRRIKPGQGLSGKIFETGETMVLADYAVWPDRLKEPKYADLHAVVGMPLKRGASIAGVMGLGHFEPGKSFGSSEVEIIERFCQLAVVALDNAQLYSRLQEELKERGLAERALKAANRALERLAGLDGLTQIANRRRFDEVLQNEWRRLGRSQAPLALILGDVDFFKRYNDTYGHQAGDKCLQSIAQTMSANAYRPADLTARYGGEEFAVLLPETDALGANFVAQRIQAAVHNLRIPHASSETAPHVTVSMGVSCLAACADADPTLLIQLADEALYDAKNKGRDRIVLRTREAPSPLQAPIALPQ